MTKLPVLSPLACRDIIITSLTLVPVPWVDRRCDDEDDRDGSGGGGDLVPWLRWFWMREAVWGVGVIGPPLPWPNVPWPIVGYPEVWWWRYCFREEVAGERRDDDDPARLPIPITSSLSSPNRASTGDRPVSSISPISIPPSSSSSPSSLSVNEPPIKVWIPTPFPTPPIDRRFRPNPDPDPSPDPCPSPGPLTKDPVDTECSPSPRVVTLSPTTDSSPQRQPQPMGQSLLVSNL